MAEVTAFRNNALPYPIYGAPWTVSFPLLDADGDPIAPSSPDSERSLNGDTIADCTNEMTQIASSAGGVYLTLTAAEMTADNVYVEAKSTGAKTTCLSLYPRKLVTIHSGTSASAGSSTSTIVLDGSASAVDDFYNGMVCIATIDSNVEVRVISDYVGSTQTATVVPDWNVAPDNNDTFVIKLPEGVQVNQANVTLALGATVQAASGRFQVDVELIEGADPTDTIRDAVVDDATRIDASSLNTASATTIPAIVADTNELQTDWANGGRLDLILDARASQTSVDDLPTSAELATALGTADDAVLAAIAALNNLSSSAAATAVLTTQMAESYAANGVAPTLAEAIFAIHQHLMDFAIAGTSRTVHELDGSTEAFVETLDSDTAPTSLTRA